MTTLKPSVAAELAELPYDFTRGLPAGYNQQMISNNIRKYFDINYEKGGIRGTSGGIAFQLLKKELGFAITGRGKSEGLKGHHVIAIRGTKAKRDWLTNGNVGMVTGPGGQMVHAGFYKAFVSLRPQLKAYIESEKPKYIHCVGHSLGGALATLTASWIQADYGIPVKVYTFGAPRVGAESFAVHTKNTIPTYRVTHGTDVVPWIPLWPFTHVCDEYLLSANRGARFSIAAHSMAEPTPGYINTAGSYDSYESMASSLASMPARKRIKLDYKLRYEATRSNKFLRLIHQALVSLLVDAGYSASALLNNAFLSSFTLYDLLARTINDIADVSKGRHEEVKGLLGYMLVFCGSMQEVGRITVAFIKKVFTMMTRSVYLLANQAIERTH